MKGLDFFFLTWLATRELLVRHKNPRLGESESALLGAAALFPSIPMDSCNPRLVVITKYPSVANQCVSLGKGNPCLASAASNPQPDPTRAGFRSPLRALRASLPLASQLT